MEFPRSPVAPMRPDADAMQRHVVALFGAATEGQVELAWIKSGSGAQLFTLDRIEALIEQAVKWNLEGRNLYLGALIKHPHTAPFARTRDEDAYACWAYWLDLDEPGAVERAEKLARKFPPTFRVTTGTTPHVRQHWWWRLDEPVTDMALVRSQVSALAALLGGDPAVCNPGRIMRLAGSIAWPTKPGRIAQVVTAMAEGPTYSADQIQHHAAPAATTAPTPRKTPTASASTASGSLGVLPPRIEDRREIYMRDTVRAVFAQMTGENGAWPTADELFTACAPQIERKVDLSRKGRISPTNWRDELTAKCRAIVAKAEAGRLGTLEDAVAAYAVRQRADRAHRPENGQQSASSSAPSITATPFVLPDPGSIPRRAWIYGRHLIRKFVSVTVAPGGVGKSTLLISDALALATGNPLLNSNVWDGPARVWMWNLEDPRDELTRRIAAAALHHGIGATKIGDRLFVDSGRDQPLRIAEQERHGGARIIRPVVDAVVAELKHRRIDVLMVDPFVSSHGVEENDNGAIDLVAKEWGRVADAANCAIDLVHHARKTGGTEVTAEHGRGAVALIAAARSVRVLNRMTKDEAEKAGVENERGYFSVLADKVNLAPAADRDWFRLADVELPNGDHVGAVEAWAWPDPFAGISLDDLRRVQTAIDGKDLAAHPASADYVGIEIARVLRISVQEAAGRARVKQLIGTWLASGSLVKERGKNPATRQTRPVIRVGVWAGEAP